MPIIETGWGLRLAEYSLSDGSRPDGDYFLADRNNHIIRRIVENAPGSFQVTTYAGQPKTEGYVDGKPLKSQFRQPSGLTVDLETGTIYVADRDNQRIRKIVVE